MAKGIARPRTLRVLIFTGECDRLYWACWDERQLSVLSHLSNEKREFGVGEVAATHLPGYGDLSDVRRVNSHTKVCFMLGGARHAQAMADSMSLSREQREMISKLEVRRPIVVTRGYPEAFRVAVDELEELPAVSDEELHARAVEALREAGVKMEEGSVEGNVVLEKEEREEGEEVGGSDVPPVFAPDPIS